MTASFRRIIRSRHRLSQIALPLGLAAVLAMTAGLSAVSTARAQDANVESLLLRVERLQRDMNTLQRYVFKGEPAPAAGAATGAAGETGSMTTTAAARIDLRLSQFEDQLRTLTGQVEEAIYRNQQINERLERLAAETDSRLRQIEQGGMAPGAMAAGAGGQAAAGSQPQVLGTIRKSDLTALQSQPVAPGTAVPQQDSSQAPVQPGTQEATAGYALVGETPREQYNHAFGLLSQANYGEAELALKSFIDRYPENPLSGNALYWLGETYYVRGDYQTAAVTFAEAYKGYPDGTKAPDNLLKLGLSLASLDAANDACGTFAELERRYPNASPSIVRRAKLERQKLSCP